MVKQSAKAPPLKPMTPEELREWRTSRGLTQKQLAELLGVKQSSVSRWEDGKRKIPPFLKLALEKITET